MVRFRGGAALGAGLDVSKDGMRWRIPADGVRGFVPGTGREVDLEAGRLVTGWMGRASDVMVGLLLADADQLGRRNSEAADVALDGESVSALVDVGETKF